MTGETNRTKERKWEGDAPPGGPGKALCAEAPAEGARGQPGPRRAGWAQAPAANAGGGLCGIKPALGGFCGEGCLTHKNALGGPGRARRCRRDDRPGGAPAGQTQDSWAPADLRTAVQYRPLKTSSDSTGDGSRRRTGPRAGAVAVRPSVHGVDAAPGGGFQNVRRGLPLSGRASPPLLC